jgi:NADP-dependent 3-hydroxy acid dehydrogenase YdfG
LAEKAIKEGMKVVIADIRADALETAKARLVSQGGDVLAVVTDVTKNEDVKALAKKTLEKFGKVNLVFNNAGVAPTGITWDTPPEIYRWVFDINIMGVVYGITTFVPIMIGQNDECHVVNIASGAALFSFAGFGLYCTSKHAVLALSEALWGDLAAKQKTNIGVTVVMPGYIKSDVANWSKTVPSEGMKKEIEALINDPVAVAIGAPGAAATAEDGTGMPASVAADMVFDAIARNELYVLPNNDVNAEVDKAVAFGRVTGQNSYPAILAAMQASR